MLLATLNGRRSHSPSRAGRCSSSRCLAPCASSFSRRAHNLIHGKPAPAVRRGRSQRSARMTSVEAHPACPNSGRLSPPAAQLRKATRAAPSLGRAGPEENAVRERVPNGAARIRPCRMAGVGCMEARAPARELAKNWPLKTGRKSAAPEHQSHRRLGHAPMLLPLRNLGQGLRREHEPLPDNGAKLLNSARAPAVKDGQKPIVPEPH
ncbi:MAG: hypothetical protein K0S81_2598 [Rhodospirillales bacterium]|nr:hypothetical protein [Rhodospirillales bacterium]